MNLQDLDDHDDLRLQTYVVQRATLLRVRSMLVPLSSLSSSTS